jgi:hypothetical protein
MQSKIYILHNSSQIREQKINIEIVRIEASFGIL